MIKTWTKISLVSEAIRNTIFRKMKYVKIIDVYSLLYQTDIELPRVGDISDDAKRNKEEIIIVIKQAKNNGYP